jgi:hypothetical protein
MRFRSLSEFHRSGIEASMLRQTFIAIAVVCATACSPEPLTTDQLYGSTRDAGRAVDASVPKLPADTASADTFVPPDAMPALDVMVPPDVQPQVFGTISGSVTDRCSGDPINALVGIANKHWCSFQGKGGFYFSNVPANVSLTLVAGAPGYKGYAQPIVILASGTTFDIKLTRLGESSDMSCDAAKPPAPVCICDKPGCGQ